MIQYTFAVGFLLWASLVSANGDTLYCSASFNNGANNVVINLTKKEDGSYAGKIDDTFLFIATPEQADANHKVLTLSIASLNDHIDLSTQATSVYPLPDHNSELKAGLSVGTVHVSCGVE